jgi:hypothetical protein
MWRNLERQAAALELLEDKQAKELDAPFRWCSPPEARATERVVRSSYM